MWPEWRHHVFVTNVAFDTVEADVFHRAHAGIELAIRDLKEGAGLEHCPSGHFFANAAWLSCAVLAHNLIRWSAKLGDVHPDDQLTVARSVRTRVLALPGRLVNRSGAIVLRLPERWPWATTFYPGARADPGVCRSSRESPTPADGRSRRRCPCADITFGHEHVGP